MLSLNRKLAFHVRQFHVFGFQSKVVILQQVNVQLDNFIGFVFLGTPCLSLYLLADGCHFFFGHGGVKVSCLVQEWREVMAESVRFCPHFLAETDVREETLQAFAGHLQVSGRLCVGTHA